MTLATDKSMTTTRPRLKADAYDTIEADWIVPALLRNVKFAGPVWEPAAGANHMYDALRKAKLNVRSSDIEPRVPGVRKADFFKSKMPLRCRDIITNPPYSVADQFVDRALMLAGLTDGKVAMLMRSEWHSAARRATLVHTHPAFAGVVVLTRRPKWFTTNDDSPRHNFSWFVWDWQTLTSEPWVRYAQ